MDIRRFGAQYRSPAYTHARIRETYETYYDIRYPNHERQAGRPLRISPANPWHREHGAAFGEKSGWERVNWYESNAAAGDEALRPRGWAGQHWSPAIGAEHRATREAVALFDESSFAKLEIAGVGRRRRSSKASATTASPAGSARSPTPRCSTAAAASSATSPSRDSARTASRSSPAPPSATTTASGCGAICRATASVRIADVTSQWACFGIWGPRARDVLAAADPAGPRQRGLPLHDRCARRRSATCRCGRCG